jgi:hypothetical protein
MSTVVKFNRQSFDCPGLEWRERAGGKRVPIWIAPKRAVKAGYTPKTVSFSPDLPEIEIAAACRRLQGEALEFLTGERASPSPFDGSFGSLANIFQTHEMSPFKIPGRLGWKTKRNMVLDLKNIIQVIGGRQLHLIRAADAQGWYDYFKTPVMEVCRGTPARQVGKERLTQARRYISLIRTILRFGAMAEISENCARECRRLADKEFGALGLVRCTTPTPRAAEVTFDMVEALCDLARGYGYYSVALAFATQFETGLRQLDVIGEWMPDEDGYVDGGGHNPKGKGRAKAKNYIWRHGIVWGHDIDHDLILTKATSKSKFTKFAKFDLKLCPLVLRELEHVPADRRIGPLIIQEGGRGEAKGQPWAREYFSSVCKDLIREMAITDPRFVNVTNMDMRSGAITEAMDGVDAETAAAANVQKLMGQHATHKQTLHYNRATLEKSRVISLRRIANRQAIKSEV